MGAAFGGAGYDRQVPALSQTRAYAALLLIAILWGTFPATGKLAVQVQQLLAGIRPAQDKQPDRVLYDNFVSADGVWLTAGSLLGSVLLLVAVLDELPGRALLF